MKRKSKFLKKNDSKKYDPKKAIKEQREKRKK